MVRELAAPFVHLSGPQALAARTRYADAVGRLGEAEHALAMAQAADQAIELPTGDEQMATLCHLLSMQPSRSAQARTGEASDTAPG